MDGLGIYLQQIAGAPLLARAEEQALARAMRDPAAPEAERRAARERLIASQVRLVVHHARRLDRRGADLDDLIGEGNRILIRAVDRYDPDRGVRLSTFVLTALRWELHNYRVADSLVPIPKHWHDPSWIRRRGGTTTPRRRASLRAARAALDRPRPGPLPADLASPSPGDGEPDDREALAAGLAALDDRSAEVLRRRYGLGPGAAPEPLRAIAATYGVAPERVRQIERAAVRALAKRLGAGE